MKVIVTGGAGFIGSHLAEYHLKKSDEVHMVDDLSRSEYNLEYLKGKYPDMVFIRGDISDPLTFSGLDLESTDIVYHCAAQVAVTASIDDPRKDYQTNAYGTFNLCDAIRRSKADPAIVFCSTNKVYGDLDLPVFEGRKRYDYKGIGGIDESYPLMTNCPYGGSKIVAEWILDTFAASYGIKSVKARMSCIYGTRQFGNEDQGWVSWFTIAAVTGRPVRIYGDGKQVRDILYVKDQNRAFESLAKNIKKTAGNSYNLGGGPKNTVSLHELLDMIEDVTGKRSEISYYRWRMGDQKVYISDTSLLSAQTGWKPKVSVRQGVQKIAQWTDEHRELFT